MNKKLIISNEFLDSIGDEVNRSSFRRLKDLFDQWCQKESKESEFYVPTFKEFKKFNDDVAENVKYIRVTTFKEYILSRKYLTSELYDTDVVVAIEGYLDLQRDVYHFNHLEDKCSDTIRELSDNDSEILQEFVSSKSQEWFKNRLQSDVIQHLEKYLKENDLKLDSQRNMIRDNLAEIVKDTHNLDLKIKRVNGRFTVNQVKSDFARIPAYQVSLYIEN